MLPRLLIRCWASALMLCCWLNAAAAPTPIEVLRTHIAKSIEVLQDPRYHDPAQATAQRERLCAIGREVFDPYLFAKLALGTHWSAFSHAEKTTFVDVFADYLCRYYLSRLQQRYRDEQVEFMGQRFDGDTRARVTAQVLWQDTRIPVEIPMALREGRWRAYDLVLLGVSAVKVYRSQFGDALSHDSPARLIAQLRAKTARNE